MKKSLFVVMCFIFFLTHQALGDHYEEVKKIADNYVKLYKKGEPAKAFETYWNWDVFCIRTFGEAYTSLNDREKKKAQKLFFDIGTGIFLNKEVLNAMMQSKFINQTIQSDKDGRIRFSFDVVFPDGKSGGQNILVFEKIRDKFWCIDAYLDNNLLSKQMASNFSSVKDKMSLISFLSNTQNLMKETQKTATETWLHGIWELTYDPDNNEKDWIIFNQFGRVVVKGRDVEFEGYYSVNNNKVKLSILIRNRPVEMEMTVSNDKSKLTNNSGAYYTKTKK